MKKIEFIRFTHGDFSLARAYSNSILSYNNLFTTQVKPCLTRNENELQPFLSEVGKTC